MDFRLKLGFYGNILGFIKLLDSTHDAGHFVSNLISCHWNQGPQV